LKKEKCSRNMHICVTLTMVFYGLKLSKGEVQFAAAGKWAANRLQTTSIKHKLSFCE
jgi:hypothetical protein